VPTSSSVERGSGFNPTVLRAPSFAEHDGEALTMADVPEEVPLFDPTLMKKKKKKVALDLGADEGGGAFPRRTPHVTRIAHRRALDADGVGGVWVAAIRCVGAEVGAKIIGWRHDPLWAR
jgi:hypothetical protein